MTGLLLVEDEEAIKEKLMKNVPWADYGFEPVGASNGLEALQILEEHPIKIMVTDVQMPKMNGIELIKEVKNRGYQMKIIVISGFAEFEYAQESIKLNVSDYLLKPFASRRLLEVVLRFKEELEKEEAEKTEINGLREQLKKNKSALSEKLLLDLLNGNAVTDNIQAQLDFLGIKNLLNRDFQVAVVEIPENQLSEMTEEEKYLLNLQLFQQMQRSASAGAYPTFVINHHRNQVVLVVFEPDSDLPIRLGEILTQARLSLNQSLACGIGHQYHNLADLAVAYREAYSALQYRYLYGLNQVFSINDLNPDRQSYHKILNLLPEHLIFDNLKIGAEHAVRDDLKAIFSEMRRSKLSPELSKIVGSNLILLACTTLNQLGYNAGDIFGDDFSGLSDVSRVESLEELEKLLVAFFDLINDHIRQKRTSINHQLVEEIRQFIDGHFTEDITLSRMANQYKISPSYLSLLFTERTGKNFIDYLTERRLKKAKELLKHTNLKIYEISNAIGYNDSFYFSNCFKKMTGVSPSEYRDGTK